MTDSGGHTGTNMIDLVPKIEIMKLIYNYVNKVKLLGCCIQNESLCVLIEFASYGI